MMAVRQNVSQPVDPLAQLNEPGEVFSGPAQIEFVQRLIALLKRAFARCLFTDQAASSFLLVSPAGKVYQVAVADDGTVGTTYVRG